MKKANITKIFYSIVFFLYLFQPPLISRIAFVYIIDVFCVILTVINFKGKIIVGQSIKKVFFCFLPFLLYFIISLFISMVNNVPSNIYMDNIQRLTFSIIHLFISLQFLLSVKYRYNYSIVDITELFILAGLWQLILVALSFILPGVKVFFYDIIISNSKSVAIRDALSNFGSYRGYGFADNLFDQFGYLMALIIVLCLAYALEKKKTSLTILSFALVIPSLLNTRTGLLLSFVGMVIVAASYLDRIKLKSIMKFVFVGLLVLIGASAILGRLSTTALGWVNDGIDEVYKLLFTSETTGTFFYLSQDIIFPEDIFWGAGGFPRMYSLTGIDIGYIQSIWMYGVAGTALLLYAYVALFILAIKKSKEKVAKAIQLGFLAIFLLYMVKMFPCHYPGCNFILLGIPAVILSDKTS